MRGSGFFACLVLSIGILACDEDAPELTAQSAVEDSALALEILSAKGDSNYFGPVEDRVYEEAKVEVVTKKKSAPVRSAPVKAKPSPVVPTPPKATLADVSVPLSEMPKPKLVHERPRKIGVIASGAALSLVTNQRVCSANTGDTFHAVVVNAIRGSNGVMIPAGARATAEIISESKWGAGLSVRVKSVRVDGKSYPLSSRVTYVLPEASHDDACIPNRTHIDVRTTEPLRVVAVN